ncbi:MAG: type II toxin-antitoxin system HicA family toxin, partial [Synergistaceae bacterium]|nr:type II toxin-antitoxin system HicA family toxin [Synergistaceae bacterium]
GAHYHYTHPVKPGKVTIPKHTKPKDFPKWLISSIEEQAGLK